MKRQSLGGMRMQTMLQLCNVTPERAGFWKGKRVLVTGATGLLGSWMTHALVGMGAEVTILVRDLVSTSLLYSEDTLAKVNVVYGTLADYRTLERTMSEYEVEYVFHLAAQTQVRVANRHPIPTFEANIMGTWNVLEAARGVSTMKGVILASSDKAYGTPKKLPYTEDMPLEGTHPYDVSKSCADLIAGCYFHTYKLPIAITRCSNLYGPGDMNFDRIIPGTIRSVLRGEQPIIRSDGKFVRDYLFIPDAVDGYLLIGEHMDKVAGHAFNISAMNRVTVLDLFEKILAVMGADMEPQVLNQASNEIREQYLSSEKIQKLLGWKAKHSLDQGLNVTADWYRDVLQ